jgi:hypothetical protein
MNGTKFKEFDQSFDRTMIDQTIALESIGRPIKPSIVSISINHLNLSLSIGFVCKDNTKFINLDGSLIVLI